MNRPRTASAVSEECVPNIGLRGRRRRLALGIFGFAAAAAVFIALVARRAETWTFLLIAPLAGSASIFFFQAREKT